MPRRGLLPTALDRDPVLWELHVRATKLYAGETTQQGAWAMLREPAVFAAGGNMDSTLTTRAEPVCR